ncbi:hypothetical protein BFN03_13455 [Rhodococcus sp. WMMA185]|nr:hypothetical protein BFN03_13455 [Rhodococcus sp. WMMA185]
MIGHPVSSIGSGSLGDRLGGLNDRRTDFSDRRTDFSDRRADLSDRRGSLGDRRGDFSDRRGDFGDRPGGITGPGSISDRRDLERAEEGAFALDTTGPNWYQRTCERAVWPSAWQIGWCDGWWTF